MRRHLLTAAAALCAVACKPSGGTGVVGDFRGPQAVAAFTGLSPGQTGALVPLIAVAASRGNELRIVDPQDDFPLRAPNLAFPLGIPTLARPIHLASASLADQGADLLAVASGGSTVQLVATWLDGLAPGSPDPGVIASWDLEPVVGQGAQILAMVAAQVPAGTPAGSPPVAAAAVGRARLLVGFSAGVDGLGGKLAVLELTRGASGAVELSGTPEVKVLGFAPVALAPAPDRIHLYAATPDVILDSSGRQVLGVAEIDMTAGPVAAWTVRGLDGRSPTVSVAAAILGERQDDPDLFGAPVLRVYAGLDPSGCGADRDIECGIATFDPLLGGLALDTVPPGPTVPRQPFRTPLYVPGVPFALAVAMPAAAGSQVCGPNQAPCPVGVNQGGYPQPLMALATNPGLIWTTATALVTAGDGACYIIDLGRFAAPDEVSLIDDPASRTQALSAQNFYPADKPADAPYLGLWIDSPSGSTAPELVAVGADMAPGFTVWPGFTGDEVWDVAWQGLLPGLVEVHAAVGRLAGGDLYVAVQRPIGSSWLTGAYLERPELGIHAADTWGVGDLALFLPFDDVCRLPVAAGQAPAAHQASIQSILPPDPAPYPAGFPGGALRVAVPSGTFAEGSQEAALQCLASKVQPGGAPLLATASVRASGLVLLGGRKGYAGRPQLELPYRLAWQDESAASGEALVLTRKARRFYYPSVGCDQGGCANYPGMTNPAQPGPVVGFRVGTYCPGTGACPGTAPVRDARIQFLTKSGLQPMSRRPSSYSEATSATSFDKSVFPSQEQLGRVFYVTYVGNTLFMVPPGQAATDAKTIR